MDDNDFQNEYPCGVVEAKKHTFTLNQVATYLNAQWNGEDGPLLTSNRGNTFHIVGEGGKSFDLDVCRHGALWAVGSWNHRDRPYSNGGFRVFHNKNSAH